MKEKCGVTEREISFSEVLWRFLQNWRLALTCAVVFAVVLSGTKYIQDKKNAEILNNQSVSTVAEIEQSLTDAEKKEVDNVRELQKEVTDKETYYEESQLMKIDPYNKTVVTLQYYVELMNGMSLSEEGHQNMRNNIVGAYNTYIVNNVIFDAGLNQYDAELVSAGVVEDTGVFVVYVTGIDEESANELADNIYETIEKYQVDVSKTIANHNLKLLKRATITAMDTSLASAQRNTREAIAQAENEVSEAIAALNSQQMVVLEGEIQAEQQTTVPVTAGISILYVIFGIVFGLIVVFIWTILEFVFGKRLKYAEEIFDMFGVQIIGTALIEETEKKKWFSAVDLWLKKVKNNRIGTREQQWNRMITKLILICQKMQVEQVYFVSSTCFGKNDKLWIDKLIFDLCENGINAQCGDDVIRNVEIFKDICENGNVVFVEKVNASTYLEMEELIAMCKMQDVRILGIVILDA